MSATPLNYKVIKELELLCLSLNAELECITSGDCYFSITIHGDKRFMGTAEEVILFLEGIELERKTTRKTKR
jgi:hypothetical protein